MADIIVVLIIAVFALLGYKKGFVKSVVGILSFVASMVLAWFLYPVAADLLKTFGVESALFESIQNTVGSYVGGDLDALPEAIRSAAEVGKDGIVYGVAEGAAKVILNIIAFICVMILSRIIIWIGVRLLKILSSIPVISFFNRIGGLLLGIFQGILVIYVILTIVFAVEPLKTSEGISRAVKESVITAQMYKNNPIVDIFAADTKDEGNLSEENRNGE